MFPLIVSCGVLILLSVAVVWGLAYYVRNGFNKGVLSGIVSVLLLFVSIAVGGTKPGRSAVGRSARTPLLTLSPAASEAASTNALGVTTQELRDLGVLSNDLQVVSYAHNASQELVRVAWTNAVRTFPGVPVRDRSVDAVAATSLTASDWHYLTNRPPQNPNLPASYVDFIIARGQLPPGAATAAFFGFAPWRDSDHDGVGDLEERLLHHTDPCLADTDGDSYLDGEELGEGMDPRDPADGFFLTGRSPAWYLANYPEVLASVTNADGSASLVLVDASASNLYHTVGLTLGTGENRYPIRISNANGFAPDGAEFQLVAGVTNTLPLRIGQRYVFGDYWPGDWHLLADDPSVVCETNETDFTLSVCRPYRLELTDIDPPDDASRCSLGHVHRRYCSFATDPDVPGALNLYDTDCITVDNDTRTLSVAQSWRPGHRSANSLRETFGALGEYETEDGVVQIVLDDLCPHSLGGSPACLCGASVYCPSCFGATAEWYNRVFGGLLTATDAAEGVSIAWNDGVSSDAYYWIEVTATNRAATVIVTPDSPNSLGRYEVMLASGRAAKIPLLAGVGYTLESRYAGLSIRPLEEDVTVANPSNRFYAVERPLDFSVVRDAEGETGCSEGHVHDRRYRIVPSITGVEGVVNLDDTSCFTTNGLASFTVRCTGEPGLTCATNGLVTGTFSYEGAVKSFSIPAALCRCDDLRRPVCPCGEATLCDTCDDTAYGQDDNWVRINFARLQAIDPALVSAEEVIASGYTNWVDAKVGVGLTNGLYKFIASFPTAPAAPTTLRVGDYTIVVTSAGEYSFVLMKGVDYAFGTWPCDDTVGYRAVDDIGEDSSRRAARALGSAVPGQWSTDGGWLNLVRSETGYDGTCLWMPTLRGSPDVGRLGPDDFPKTFFAILSDCCAGIPVSYHWSASEMTFRFASPDAQSTSVDCLALPQWGTFSMSVEATIGGTVLRSELGGTYGSDGHPGVVVKISAPEVVFLNDDLRETRFYHVECSLYSPVDTNVILSLRHTGNTTPGFFADREALEDVDITQSRQIALTAGSTEIGCSFYLTCLDTGAGSLVAEVRDERGRDVNSHTKSYRCIEPLQCLVTTEKGPNGRLVNPSRLVYGSSAYLKVGVRGNFAESEVKWTVLGPATLSATSGFLVEVTPTADSGTVTVEARFGDDAEYHPRFVLPIVKPRNYEIQVFYVQNYSGEVPKGLKNLGERLAVANSIFAQAGVSFSFRSTPIAVSNSDYATIPEFDLITVEDGQPSLSRTLSTKAQRLLSDTPAFQCFRLYIVHRIESTEGIAFSAPGYRAVFMTSRGSVVVLAHELGHLLGLKDIYTVRDTESGTLSIPFLMNAPGRSMFLDTRRDWGDEQGRSYYPDSESYGTIIEKLLMYGIDQDSNDMDLRDIPSGRVEGFSKESKQQEDLFDVEVGADVVEGRGGRYE